MFAVAIAGRGRGDEKAWEVGVYAMGVQGEGGRGECVLAPTDEGRAGGFDERAAGRALDFRVGRVPDGVVGAAGGRRVLAEELESV